MPSPTARHAIALALFASSASAETVIRERSVCRDGQSRRYLVVLPASYEPGNPAVVVLHGGTQSAGEVVTPPTPASRWVEVAEREGLALLVPNGTNITDGSGAGDNQKWNDLLGSDAFAPDDVGFIAGVIEREAPRVGFDRGRVFVAGSSNGGMMTYRMLIERPELFAGAAAFIANLPERQVDVPERAVPVMIMNGDADPLMPWEGGRPGVNPDRVRSGEDTLDYWLSVHGLDRSSENASPLPNTADDGCLIVDRRYGPATAPPAGVSPVRFYRVINGGHAIPVPPPGSGLGPAIGIQCMDAHGVDLAWEFFATAPDNPPSPSGRVAKSISEHLVVDTDRAVRLVAVRDAALAAGSLDLNCDGSVGPADLIGP